MDEEARKEWDGLLAVFNGFGLSDGESELWQGLVGNIQAAVLSFVSKVILSLSVDEVKRITTFLEEGHALKEGGQAYGDEWEAYSGRLYDELKKISNVHAEEKDPLPFFWMMLSWFFSTEFKPSVSL